MVTTVLLVDHLDPTFMQLTEMEAGWDLDDVLDDWNDTNPRGEVRPELDAIATWPTRSVHVCSFRPDQAYQRYRITGAGNLEGWSQCDIWASSDYFLGFLAPTEGRARLRTVHDPDRQTGDVTEGQIRNAMRMVEGDSPSVPIPWIVQAACDCEPVLPGRINAWLASLDKHFKR
jgi:hypothetical protein